MKEKPLVSMKGTKGKGKINLYKNQLQVVCGCGCRIEVLVPMSSRTWRILRNRIEDNLLPTSMRRKKEVKRKPRVDIEQSRGALVTIEPQRRRKRKKCSKKESGFLLGSRLLLEF